MKYLVSSVLLIILNSNIYCQVNILQVDQITTKNGLPQNSVQTILQDKDGFMWFSSFSSLCKYDGYNFTQYHPEIDNPHTLYSSGIYNIFTDSLNILWVSFFDTTVYCKYDFLHDNFERLNSNDVEHYVKSQIMRNPGKVYAHQKNTKYVWFYHDGFLHKIDQKSGTKSKFCLDYSGINSLETTLIRSMFMDSFGTLWIGTDDQGLYKINTNTKPFYAFDIYKNKCSSNINDNIRVIFDDGSDEIWLGTYVNGIIKYNKKKNKITYLKHNPNNLDHSITNNNIRALYKDKYGYLWIGTKAGLTIYNEKKNTYDYYTRNTPNQIPSPWVHSIIEDHQGIIWISTFYGVVMYNRNTDKYTSVDPELTLKNSKVSDIIEDSNNHIWIATQGGGFSRLTRTKEYNVFDTLHFQNIPGNSNSLTSNRVFSILETSNGDIWAATDLGINCLDTKTGLIRRYTIQEGLPDNMIMGMLEDSKNNIWVSHKKGITKINIGNGEMIHFSEHDGLLSNDFSENSCYKNEKTGELYFGNAKGINSFFPDSIHKSSIEPIVYITGLQVLNQKVDVGEVIGKKVLLKKALIYTDTIYLHNNHKSFSLEFSGLQYLSSQANNYAYILKGYDKKWINVGAARRIATYSNLKHGEYEFIVKASNGDGNWSENADRLFIIISPPWWNTIGAFIVYFILAFLMFYWVYTYIVSKEQFKNQLRYEKMKASKMQELDKLKIQFFTNISHELRTPLTLLIDPLQKIRRGDMKKELLEKYFSIMNNNAQRLLKLVNQLLDFRKIETKKHLINKKQSDIAAFIANVTEAFTLNAQHRNINLIFKPNPQRIIALFDSEMIEKIIFNLLSNAFKYTQDGGEIHVLLNYVQFNGEDNTNLIEIKVVDNGLGIPVDSLNKIFDVFYQAKLPAGYQGTGTGIGLALTHDLVELHGGEIKAKNNEQQGATFQIILPVGDISLVNETFVTPHINSIVEELASAEIENSNVEINDNRPTILIIDDNREVRQYIRMELEKFYNIIEAGNGQEGLEMAKENTPDLVVSDIMMPVLDGIAFCERLKSDTQISHIPVVLLTARQSEEYIVEGYEKGADAYISKPFNSNILKARIKNILDNRKKLQDTFNSNPFFELKKIANTQADEEFLNNAVSFIEKNISEPEFNIDLLSDNLKVSRRHLTQKIKALTGQKVNDFVKTIRLNKAAELLLSTDLTISEVAFKIGYSIPSNFSRSFQKQFQMSPSEYISSFNG